MLHRRRIPVYSRESECEWLIFYRSTSTNSIYRWNFVFLMKSTFIGIKSNNIKWKPHRFLKDSQYFEEMINKWTIYWMFKPIMLFIWLRVLDLFFLLLLLLFIARFSSERIEYMRFSYVKIPKKIQNGKFINLITFKYYLRNALRTIKCIKSWYFMCVCCIRKIYIYFFLGNLFFVWWIMLKKSENSNKKKISINRLPFALVCPRNRWKIDFSMVCAVVNHDFLW